MSENYEIRAVVKLRLDPVTEKDVINEIEELVSHRKFGDYIANLLKFASEHREDLAELGLNASNRSRVDTHKQMFGQLNSELNSMKSKVDAIFEMALSLKTAYEIGCVVGLEQQTDNILAAQIVLQNQMNKLRKTFGENYPMQFEGMPGVVRNEEIEKAAKSAADMAVSHYGETISLLANNLNAMMNQMYSGPNLYRPNNVDTGYVERNLQIASSGYETGNNERNNAEKKSAHVEETVKLEEKKVESVEMTPVSQSDELTFTDDISALAEFYGV